MANPRSLAAARLLLRAAKAPCYPSSPSAPLPFPSARSASSWPHKHDSPNHHHHPHPHTQSQRDHTSLSHGRPHAQPQHGHHRPAACAVTCSSGSSSSGSSRSSSSSGSSQQARGVIPLVDSRAGPSSRAESPAQDPLLPYFSLRHLNSPAPTHAFAPSPHTPPTPPSAFSHARSCRRPRWGIGCLGPVPTLPMSSASHGGRGWSFSCGVAAAHSHSHWQRQQRQQQQHQQQQQRSVTYMPRPGDGKPRAVTLLPGDGVGPLVTGAVVQVMEAMHAPVYFETFDVSGRMSSVPQEVLDSLRKNKVGLKGGLLTPVGGGVSSLNVQLRKELDLFAHLVFAHNMEGLPTRHDGVNIVVIRENTEGEYSGLEHEVVPGVVESLKVITKFCSERIAQYAFEYAYLNSRRRVTAVHKANIMKLADGLFLESCRSVAQHYPSIQYSEIIVDNCCMQLVARPQQFDVMVTPNLYGTLVANAAAGICGGSTIMPGGNVGEDVALFEQGASAGNVGTPEQVAAGTANPTALLLSAAMMLRHLQFPTFADNLEAAVRRVVRERRCLTPDVGGSATTQHMVDAVIGYLV